MAKATNSPLSQKELAYLGEDLHVEGTVRCTNRMVINGSVEGSVQGKAEVTVGRQGVVQGSIDCSQAVISGKVLGNLTVRNRLEISGGGRVKGEINVQPGQMIIREGAVLEGRCVALPPQSAAPQAKLALPESSSSAS
ncbi:MAG: hypothetical protein CL923_05450 [Deltaproteobacteria bacterium]|jgi:cytoskeletal protein CcmA (bactofilin family)|nr:hypothetical protein [Deltaproteobacteria bacterium]MDP7156637.1 polymer-forming cytoskeletal protein [SAR324 cluster bacterium]MDP7316886.1 polymer-forming cytoskeletal protein [SAR324 cluster bacterium]MDP7629931.1 polymer-forming cytoskeletal protein [SAR324 cluster bacterium]